MFVDRFKSERFRYSAYLNVSRRFLSILLTNYRNAIFLLFDQKATNLHSKMLCVLIKSNITLFVVRRINVYQNYFFIFLYYRD